MHTSDLILDSLNLNELQILKGAELSTRLSMCPAAVSVGPTLVNLQIQALLVLVAPVSLLTPLAPTSFPRTARTFTQCLAVWLCRQDMMGFGAMQTGVETLTLPTKIIYASLGSTDCYVFVCMCVSLCHP